MIRALLLLSFVGLVATCAPISEDACRSGNWQAIGIGDGIKGEPANRVGDYAETCAEFGVAPDLAAYQAGRTEGLKTYCTPDNAYAQGRKGNRLRPVCTPDVATLISPANRHGLRYHAIDQDMDKIRNRIDSRESELAANYSGTLTPAQEIEAAQLRSEIRSLNHELFKLRLDLRRYDSWPP